ncbi:hypothetical protein OE88DRAFT_1655570 [Heliocybe sulcata]|uniref:Uncharacterized protein n=1 Tax=Heliocybe sulcata TaxID=5364 RepID=A0A5C3N7Y9_9AGAM|nr:hypothetical protein OE88DRAFT_1655570 [Heliocybe sulcata]
MFPSTEREPVRNERPAFWSGKHTLRFSSVVTAFYYVIYMAGSPSNHSTAIDRSFSLRLQFRQVVAAVRHR